MGHEKSIHYQMLAFTQSLTYNLCQPCNTPFQNLCPLCVVVLQLIFTISPGMARAEGLPHCNPLLPLVATLLCAIHCSNISLTFWQMKQAWLLQWQWCACTTRCRLATCGRAKDTGTSAHCCRVFHEQYSWQHC